MSLEINIRVQYNKKKEDKKKIDVDNYNRNQP